MDGVAKLKILKNTTVENINDIKFEELIQLPINDDYFHKCKKCNTNERFSNSELCILCLVEHGEKEDLNYILNMVENIPVKDYRPELITALFFHSNVPRTTNLKAISRLQEYGTIGEAILTLIMIMEGDIVDEKTKIDIINGGRIKNKNMLTLCVLNYENYSIATRNAFKTFRNSLSEKEKSIYNIFLAILDDKIKKYG